MFSSGDDAERDHIAPSIAKTSIHPSTFTLGASTTVPFDDEKEVDSPITFIVRDSHGFVHGAFIKCITGRFSPVVAKVLAIREGALFAREANLSIGIIESDSQAAITALSNWQVSGEFGLLIEEIYYLNEHLSDIKYSFVRREGNGVAHQLAQLAHEENTYVTWRDAIPLVISSQVEVKMKLSSLLEDSLGNEEREEDHVGGRTSGGGNRGHEPHEAIEEAEVVDVGVAPDP
ncbi:hypothetical protein Scep_019531 [Stephania cephalantha]|uniref:RNase H type-1 domain-containing protein n=1 Tax=Stephania cephalantha TaxID=152367 RepID=A0AAP0NLG1_9MAGN